MADLHERHGGLQQLSYTCRNHKPRRERVTSKILENLAEPGKPSFTTRRVVDAPRALVFDTLTTPVASFGMCSSLRQEIGDADARGRRSERRDRGVGAERLDR